MSDAVLKAIIAEFERQADPPSGPPPYADLSYPADAVLDGRFDLTKLAETVESAWASRPRESLGKTFQKVDLIFPDMVNALDAKADPVADVLSLATNPEALCELARTFRTAYRSPVAERPEEEVR
jgi:hypothetical protein